MPRTLAAVLFGFSLLIYFPMVAADSTPYPAKIEFQGMVWYAIPPNSGGWRSGTPQVSPEAVCSETIASVNSSGGYPQYRFVGTTHYENSISKGDCLTQATDGGAVEQWWRGYTRGWQRFASCTRGGYVDDWEAATPKCACSPGYQFPPGGIVVNYQHCVPDPCTIPDLLPKPGDACSMELEARFGVLAEPTACKNKIPAVNVMNDPAGEKCFRSKLKEINVAYSGPTSTFRTTGYQNHIADVWYLFKQHTNPLLTPEAREACTDKRNIILAEQYGPPPPGHRLGFEPSGFSHSGNAFDVDGSTVDALEAKVPSIQTFLDTATANTPACNLEWGRTFGDKYHFTLKK